MSKTKAIRARWGRYHQVSDDAKRPDSQVEECSFEMPTQVGRIHRNKISAHLPMIGCTSILSCFSNSASIGNLNLKKKILECFFFHFSLNWEKELFPLLKVHPYPNYFIAAKTNRSAVPLEHLGIVPVLFHTTELP